MQPLELFRRRESPDHVAEDIRRMTCTFSGCKSFEGSEEVLMAKCVSAMGEVATKWASTTVVLHAILAWFAWWLPRAARTRDNCVEIASLLPLLIGKPDAAPAVMVKLAFCVAKETAPFAAAFQATPAVAYALIGAAARHLRAYDVTYMAMCYIQTVAPLLAPETWRVVIAYVADSSTQDPVLLMNTLACLGCVPAMGRPHISRILDAVTSRMMGDGFFADRADMYGMGCATIVSILDAHPLYADSLAVGRCLQVAACFPHADPMTTAYLCRRMEFMGGASKSRARTDMAVAMEQAMYASPKAGELFLAAGCVDPFPDLHSHKSLLAEVAISVYADEAYGAVPVPHPAVAVNGSRLQVLVDTQRFLPELDEFEVLRGVAATCAHCAGTIVNAFAAAHCGPDTFHLSCFANCLRVSGACPCGCVKKM